MNFTKKYKIYGVLPLDLLTKNCTKSSLVIYSTKPLFSANTFNYTLLHKSSFFKFPFPPKSYSMSQLQNANLDQNWNFAIGSHEKKYALKWVSS